MRGGGIIGSSSATANKRQASEDADGTTTVTDLQTLMEAQARAHAQQMETVMAAFSQQGSIIAAQSEQIAGLTAAISNLAPNGAVQQQQQQQPGQQQSQPPHSHGTAGANPAPPT